jgi:hypothetical protein
MPDHTYKLAKALSRPGVNIAPGSHIWLNKNLKDVRLCANECKSLLARHDVQISEQTRNAFKG